MKLFTQMSDLPNELHTIGDLRPEVNLLSIFEDCHDHIYANEGLLKDKIFNEMMKLIFMKMIDENRKSDEQVRFGITAREYEQVLIGRDNQFIERIGGLFSNTRNKYSKYFENDNGLILSHKTLAFTVSKLQFISLSQTPRDVKGEAFQTFINKYQRGDRGEFFTPNPVVRLAVGILNPKQGELLVDPAAGSGGFLIEAIKHINNGSSSNVRSDHKSENIRRFIRGIEFNPDIARSAMIRFSLEGGNGDEIECKNSLREIDEHIGKYDVLITNPPFGTKGRIQDPSILDKYDLAFRWQEGSKGIYRKTDKLLAGQTPEILFLERCIALLKPGGRMAIVLPDGLLQNSSSEHIRQWLSSQTDVFAVISLPQETFIPYGTGIKTSLIFIRKNNGVKLIDRIFMARIDKIGYDAKGQPIYKKDDNGKPIVEIDGRKIIDDDIDSTIDEFNMFSMGKDFTNNDNIFSHNIQILNGRLDVEHYLPSDLEMISRLTQRGAKRLAELAEVVIRREQLHDNFKYRYIAISDIDAKSMRVINQQELWGHEAPSRASYEVNKGDIITAISGASTGSKKHVSAMITDEEESAICSNGLAVLRNIRIVDPHYLLCYLRTDNFLRQVKRQMTGHAIPAISKEGLGNILVAIPNSKSINEISEKIKTAQKLWEEAQKISNDAISLASILDDEIEIGWVDSNS